MVRLTGRRALNLLGCGALTLVAACSIRGPVVEAPLACGDVAAQGIRWYAVAQPRDAGLNEAWCRTVGPSVVVPNPPREGSAWNSGDSLLVVAWNSNVGGGDLAGFLEDELDLDCSTPGPVSTHFVLLLQEAHRRSAALPPVAPGPHVPWRIEPDPRPSEEMDVVTAARSCGLALSYVPSARNGHDLPDEVSEDKGNAILSTLPLRDFEAIELPFESGRKVAVAASVESPSGEVLRLVSVHLDVTSTLYRTLVTGNRTRLRQVSGLTEALALGPPKATLVGGDFNTWAAGDAALDHLRRVFPQSPPWDGRNTRGPNPTDHIFFGQAPSPGVAIVPGSYQALERAHRSDHLARVVRLHDTRPDQN
ncbi:MAG: endonuclease/exonuclease/phosphatase family protein [Longimicrobiales bacterium]